MAITAQATVRLIAYLRSQCWRNAVRIIVQDVILYTSVTMYTTSTKVA
jgi:hypothetical protein